MKRDREEGELDNMANCLMLLTKVGESEANATSKGRDKRDGEIGDFKCKTCNRRFSSFQALGGHRASHKKPKLMITDLSCRHQLPCTPTTKQQPRMHPCPICGLQFAIGQALGGHMRKHRTAINDGLLNRRDSDSLSILKKSKNGGRLNLCLDLNLMPLEDDDLKLNLRTPVLNCFI
ncbi:zinc finger protein ZAT12-like [Vigna umbellata]|uniref:zinc finger protein ZAT12-like n=1 Tax=Vigna umbellata TaxID=87088 RepID=UPI001F5ECC20|nr:zinc finger protein ZAT12-like [Vigna umbellata]